MIDDHQIAHAMLPALMTLRPRISMHSRETLSGFGFLAPTLGLFSIFVYYPLLATAYVSLTKWNIVSPERPFVGLDNYARLLEDEHFASAIRNTAVYSIGVVGTSMVLGLGLAILLNRRIAARGLYRTILFTPFVTSLSAMGLLWTWVFDRQFGLVNAFLRMLSLPPPGWLSSVDWALPAIMIMAVWHNLGYNVVILLVGLQNVPSELVEAAKMDGATGRRLFWHITLPLLSPTTFFLLVTGLLVSFQVFDAVAVMTQGGPLDSTNVLVFYVYQSAFRFFEMGYASTIAMVLFLIVVTLTALQLLASRRWVHYG